MRYPRYTTFTDDELAAAIHTLTPANQPIPTAASLRQEANGSLRQGTQPSGRGRSRLLKEHYCTVTYPDGANGICKYVRFAPTFHQFQFRHEGSRRQEQPSDGLIAGRFLKGTPLPMQHLQERMENTAEAVERKAKELAASAFQAAIRHELRDRFLRATPPAGRKPDAKTFQFTAKRAKEIGGKYALCVMLATNLLPDGSLFDSLEEANAAWEACGSPNLIVACACRWTRRWEIPTFNSLYRDHPLPDSAPG